MARVHRDADARDRGLLDGLLRDRRRARRAKTSPRPTSLSFRSASARSRQPRCRTTGVQRLVVPVPPVVLASVEPSDAACVLESVRAGALAHVPGPAPIDDGGAQLRHAVVDRVADRLEGPRLVRLHRRRARGARDAHARARWHRRGRDRRGLPRWPRGPRGRGHGDRRSQRRAGLREDATVLLLCTEGATDPANYERLVGRAPTPSSGRSTVSDTVATSSTATSRRSRTTGPTR